MNFPLPRPGENNFWYLDRDNDSAIVFVHGIFSDSRGCWSREKPPTYWPQLIAADQQFARYSIFMGGYYTALDAGPYDVANCAHELFAAMGRRIDGLRSVLERKNIIFLCHSTGGIVVRYMLESQVPQFEKHPLGLLLIASPSFGSKWATRLGLLSRFYNQRLGARLEWGNWSLEDLDDRFKRSLAEHRLPGLIGQEAYENHFIVHRRWLPDRSFVVPKESAGKYFGPPILLRNTDHFTTVKPDGSRHPAYELLSDFVARFEREQDELTQRIAKTGGVAPQVPASVEQPAKRKRFKPEKPMGLLAELLSPTPAAAPLSVNEMLSAEEKAEKRRRRRIFGAVLVLFSISLPLGYFWGKLYAIDFTSPDSAYYYLATHSQWRQLDDKRGELSVEAGVKRFNFVTGDRAVTSAYLPVSYASVPKRDAFDDHEKFEALTAPIFIAETGVWIRVFNAGASLTQTQERLLMLAGFATGGVIGFFWGMQDKGNASLPEFQSRLQSDTELWRTHEKNLREICYLIRRNSLIRQTLNALKDTESSQTPAERALRKKTEEIDDWNERFFHTHPEMRSCYVELPALPSAPPVPSEEITTPTSKAK